mmetsp:Transcript_21738/g.84786  ORF Transcript_21738/g.84786 Transcript_21738/m.84786 type:complete len:418 (+) Transcript_21738:9334-10587(+)
MLERAFELDPQIGQTLAAHGQLLTCCVALFRHRRQRREQRRRQALSGLVHLGVVLTATFEVKAGNAVAAAGAQSELEAGEPADALLDTALRGFCRTHQLAQAFADSLSAGQHLAGQFNAHIVDRYRLGTLAVLFQQRQPALQRLDQHRQPRHLALVRIALVAPHGEQRRQLCHLRIHARLLDHQRIARGQRLHLRVRQRREFHVLDRPQPLVAAHHLRDETRLGLQGLPHVAVETALGDVAEDLHVFALVALAQDAPFALLHVARPPGRVQVVQRRQPGLHVGADAHLGRRSEQHPHPAFAHGLEQRCLLRVAVGVVHERDLGGRHAGVDQALLQVVIDAEGLAFLRRRQVAEHQLRAAGGAGHSGDLQLDVGQCGGVQGCLGKWFDPGHRQGSNDGKVNTQLRFCLLALWASGMSA